MNTFTSRLKSFLWRLGSYLFVSAVAYVGTNAGLFIANPQVVAVVALICGEVTKALNK